MELKDMLLKRALGFEVEEVVEEYSEKDGNLVLQKKKVTKKFIPPDAMAMKYLLNQQPVDDNSELNALSYNELIALKDELIEEINKLT